MEVVTTQVVFNKWFKWYYGKSITEMTTEEFANTTFGKTYVVEQELFATYDELHNFLKKYANDEIKLDQLIYNRFDFQHAMNVGGLMFRLYTNRKF